jgi:hypothetical protein
MFICNRPEECAYCRATNASGERWVREKIYEPALVDQGPRYRRYHAELFTGEELSCWKKKPN